MVYVYDIYYVVYKTWYLGVSKITNLEKLQCDSLLIAGPALIELP